MGLDWTSIFEEAKPYGAFLDQYATPAQRQRWDASYARDRLSAEHRAILSGFVRELRVVCLVGAWCGDCSNQCPVFEQFASVAPSIRLRFLDRDARPEVRDALSINGGRRVPVLVFLSEDGNEVARFGDRTLSTYRKLAAEQLGPACPTGLVLPSDEELAVATGEWLAEFERAHLILRLSARLREKYGD